MTAATHLQELLATLRRQRRRRLLVEAAASIVIAAAAAILAGSLVTRVFGLTGTGVLAARIIGYGLVLAAAVRYLLLPLLRRASDAEFALYVEERAPGLQQALLSAVQELDGRSAPQASPALTARVVQQAVHGLRPISADGRIERPRAVRAGRVLAAAAAALALMLALGPDDLRDAARALFAPWSVAVAATPAPPMVLVTPGNAEVPRGGALDVRADLANFSADGAELVFRSDSTMDWVRVPMGRESVGGTFAGRLFDITAPTEYYVEAYGVRSATYRLRVSDLPAVQRLAVELRYPAYTGREAERIEDGGDVAAVVGTTVIIEPAVTRPVREGTLTFDDGTSVPLALDAAGQLRGSFRVRTSGFYRVDLVAADGRRVPGGVQYAVEALSDRPPQVRIVTPGRDTKVNPLEEVTIEAAASDDHGVRALELRYRVNGGEEQRVVMLDAGARARDEAQAAHTLMLEEIALTPGDLVAYHAVARDAIGQEALSDIYFLEIRPWSRNYRQAESGGEGGGGGGGGENPGEFVQRQRDIVAGTYNWVRDSAATPERLRAEDVTTLAIGQGRLREEVEQLATRLQQRGVAGSDTTFMQIQRALADGAREMKNAEEQLGRRSGRAALPFEERALALLQRADALYRDVQLQQQQGGGGGGGGGAQRAEDLADLFELETDRMRNQYEAVQQQSATPGAQEVDETLERLRQLASRQQQENERMQRQAEAMRERMGREASGGGGGAQRELARQAEEEARRLERLAREQNDPELARAAQQMQRASDAMRQAAGGSEAQGTAALEQLRRATRGLEEARNRGISRDVEQLAERAEALEERQRGIQEGVAGLAGTGGPERAARMQQLNEQKDALNAEVQRFEAEADRVAREGRSDQPAASSQVRQASEAIRESRIRDRIQFSRNVMRGGSPEYANSFEETITHGIAEAAERARAAVRALEGESVARRQERTLDEARALVQGLESLRERTAGEQGEARSGAGQQEQGQQGQGQQGQGQQGQGQQGEQGGLGGQQGGMRARGQASTAGGAGSAGPQDARQFAREFGLRRQNAERLRDLAREQGVDVADLERAIRDLRQLESGRPLGDPLGAAQLQSEVIDRLKAFEFGLYRQLTGAGTPRAALGARSPVPSEYRAEIEEYYRSLARPRP
jgi:hypothetical protein